MEATKMKLMLDLSMLSKHTLIRMLVDLAPTVGPLTFWERVEREEIAPPTPPPTSSHVAPGSTIFPHPTPTPVDSISAPVGSPAQFLQHPTPYEPI